MKKTGRWRQMRLQRKREKLRLRKQTKDRRDTSYEGEHAADSAFGKIFNFMFRKVPEDKKLDRRRRKRNQGDR